MSTPLPFKPVFIAERDQLGPKGDDFPFPPLEVALVGVTALHMCFLPWALGAMHVWSQLTSLGLAIIGIILALLSRTQREGPSSSSASIEIQKLKLFRFPIFWAGLAVLLYISVQGLNPAWRFMSNSDFWWLKPVAHRVWFPSGVDAPFVRSNPWRALVIYGSLWLFVCSVWTGIRRKKSYAVLFFILVGNAFLLSILGLLQKSSATERIFWSYLPSNAGFVSSFIYPNHAGAYFNLMVALAVGLCGWHLERGQKKEKIGWAGLFLFAAIFIGISVFLSYSRMSILLLITLTVLLGGFLAIRSFRKIRPMRDRRELIPLFFALGLAALVSGVLITTQAEKIWARFAPLIGHPANQVSGRAIARQATRDMISDHWFWGWGAGCFRYGFPLYAQKYPEIYYSANGAHQYWEHAHDDLLEFPAELGAAGMIPLVVILGYVGWELFRRRIWHNPLSLSIVLGSTILGVHAWVDFVFQNPAVLFTAGVLLAASIRWAELDQPMQGHATRARKI